MDKFFNVLTYVIGFLFLLMGLQWLVDPTSAAAGLGMSLLFGHGLSTQIGDLASFFLVVGVFTLCAVVKKNKIKSQEQMLAKILLILIKNLL